MYYVISLGYPAIFKQFFFSFLRNLTLQFLWIFCFWICLQILAILSGIPLSFAFTLPPANSLETQQIIYIEVIPRYWHFSGFSGVFPTFFFQELLTNSVAESWSLFGNRHHNSLRIFQGNLFRSYFLWNYSDIFGEIPVELLEEFKMLTCDEKQKFLEQFPRNFPKESQEELPLRIPKKFTKQYFLNKLK